MKQTLTFETGKTTCAYAPGKFCRWAGAGAFGTRFVCRLFKDEQGYDRRLEDVGGWLQRLPECIDELGT